MRRLLLVASFLVLSAPSADAATLPVDGTLSFQLGTLPALVFTGSAVGSSAGGVGSAATIPAGLINGTVDYSQPISPPASGLSLITVPAPYANAAGSFAPGGTMGNSIVANLFFTGGGSGGTIDLNYVGSPGTWTYVVSGIPYTVIGETWTNLGVTTGNPTVVTKLMHAPAGIPLTVTATAFDKRTAGGAGTLQLVAPVTVKLFGGNLGTQPLIGTLTLQFVPEPGTLLLLGGGALALTSWVRRRPRS